jgi:toxin FitB
MKYRKPILRGDIEVRFRAIYKARIRSHNASLTANARVKRWFENFLENYADVLPITPEIAKHAGELRGGFQQGDNRSQADMLLAATALGHKLVLVTRNEKDFAGCGVKVLNPW